MEHENHEGRMRPFKKETWSEFLPEGKSPISYLLERDVPVYFRVDPVHHLVYRCYQQELSPLDESKKNQFEEFLGLKEPEVPMAADVSQLQIEAFHDDLAYLRIDRVSLEQIDISMSCKTPMFTRCGLAMARTYRVKGRDSRGRPIKELQEMMGVPGLVKVEFDEAAIIDRNAWNKAKISREGATRLDPLDYALRGELEKRELFLDATDVARLKAEMKKTFVPVPYPFGRHEDRMPGLYWMFQAAYLLNDKRDMEGGEKGVGAWLKKRAPEWAYKYRSLRTAEKFVWKELDRRGKGEPNLEEMCEHVDIEKYKVPYISIYFSVTLAIADWWIDRTQEDPNISGIDLAQMLIQRNFSGHEVAHLVYLIARESISSEEEIDLKRWTKTKTKKRWKPVREG